MTKFPSLQLSSQLDCTSFSKMCREFSYTGYWTVKEEVMRVYYAVTTFTYSRLDETNLVTMSLQSSVI